MEFFIEGHRVEPIPEGGGQRIRIISLDVQSATHIRALEPESRHNHVTAISEIRRERIDVPAPLDLVEKEVEDGSVVPEIESHAAAELADIGLNEFEMLTPVAHPGLHMCKSCRGDIDNCYIGEPGSDQLVTQS